QGFEFAFWIPPIGGERAEFVDLRGVDVQGRGRCSSHGLYILSNKDEKGISDGKGPRYKPVRPSPSLKSIRAPLERSPYIVAVNAATVTLRYYLRTPTISISTRRFCARPSRVALEAIGLLSPLPST